MTKNCHSKQVAAVLVIFFKKLEQIGQLVARSIPMKFPFARHRMTWLGGNSIIAPERQLSVIFISASATSTLKGDIGQLDIGPWPFS